MCAKEGKCAVKVADVSDFWNGQKEIKILDANLTAVPEKRELFAQYIDTGAALDFTQGLDIRLLDEDDIADINRSKVKGLHFAWDNPRADLKGRFANYATKAQKHPNGDVATVYVLTNYDSTIEEDLYRIYTLRDMGYMPYVMIYDKQHSDRLHKDLQRWVNTKIIVTCPNFKDYRR